MLSIKSNEFQQIQSQNINRRPSLHVSDIKQA